MPTRLRRATARPGLGVARSSPVVRWTRSVAWVGRCVRPSSQGGVVCGKWSVQRRRGTRASVAVVRPRGELDAYTAPDLRSRCSRRLARPASGGPDRRLGPHRGRRRRARGHRDRGSAERALAGHAVRGDRFAGAAGVDRGARGRTGLCCCARMRRRRARRSAAGRHRPRAASRSRPTATPRRWLVRRCLSSARTRACGGDGEAAQLVASELVTNAVVHARHADRADPAAGRARCCTSRFATPAPAGRG